MSLAQTLGTIGAAHDLPRLLAELGHEPLWQELPPLDGSGRAASIASAGAFMWLGVETDGSAAVVASRIVQRFTREGHVAGVVVFHPAGRELAIGVGFGSGEILRVDLDRPDPVALASLARLRPAGEQSATAYAARAAEALAGRGVGREFFREFRTTLQALQESLGGAGPRDPSERRALALLQLTRVLFLYFVQSKGWLDGRPDFLARTVDACLAHRRGLHRHLLQPLFFGALNRPANERSATVRSFGRIPFLNGGLFEPHPLERRYRIVIPDRAWRDAFDRLFERFHFTVAEDSADGPAIAPDMLGRTFEGVMDPADRKSSGTYYTPAVLVREVVRAAFAALVGSRLEVSDERAALLLDEGDPAVTTLLRSVSVLDPACGSGAFLLGALDQLAPLRGEHSRSRSTARRWVLQHNLFGVDLDAMAVRLAELRLWLAVVADDATDDPRRVRPLPNLDCLVRQGDSLFDPPGLARSDDPALARQLGALRAQLVTASGRPKRSMSGELRRLERAAALSGCITAERTLENEARELLETARAPRLFHDAVRLSRSDRDRLGEIRRALARSRATRRRLARENEVPWFHYGTHFADIVEGGGFDAVIGNPPWVRAEELAPEVRARLADRYRWWRGVRSGGFAHRPDLAIAFIERAHELAKAGGVVALLVPAKLAAAGYASAAREALACRVTLHAAADLTSQHGGAFDATVYPMALVTTKRRPGVHQRVRAALDPSAPATTPQPSLTGAPWVLGSEVGVISRLCAAHPGLGERYRCRLGVKTGADAVFLDPARAEPELLRWAVRGRDVAAYRVEPRRRLLWPYDSTGAPLHRLPCLAARHLAAHEPLLRRRADYGDGPYWMLFRTQGATAPHRVIWPDLAPTLAAAVLTGGESQRLIAMNTCYVVATSSADQAHALAAWLNSTWLRAVACATAAPASGGCFRFTATTVAALPLAIPTADRALSALGRAAAQGEPVHAQVDDRVATLLSLSESDRAVLAALGRATSAHRR